MKKRSSVLVAVCSVVALCACARPDEPAVLPDTAEVEAWFDGAASVTIENDRLVIDAVMEPDHLTRGGSLWQRATPFFYLFNVQIRQVLLDFPDVDGVDVVVRGEDERPLASVSLDRSTLSIYEWDRAVAYTSRAQRDGTEQPRHLVELLDWAEDRVEHSYSLPSNGAR
jgi:hypothetical protein